MEPIDPKKLQLNNQEPKSSVSGYIVVVVLLSIALIILTIFFFRTTKRDTIYINELVEVKDSLVSDLNKMKMEYDELETNNVELQQQVDKDKARIDALIAEVQKQKNIRYSDVRKLEKELETLRSIMKNYLKDLDSLNTMNKQLVSENIAVKRQMEEKHKENSDLKQRQEEMSTTIEKAAIVRMRGVYGTGLTSRNGDTERASRMVKFKVCFTVSENSLAQAGSRTYYLALKSPDGVLLQNSKSGNVTIEESEITYSEKRTIDYQKTDVDVCIFFDLEKQKIKKGKYSLNIYSEEGVTLTGEMLLK